MKILGVDPGIGRCGWGVLEAKSSTFKVQSYGCIETSSKLSIEQRIGKVYENISKIIKKNKPDVLAIEELFFGNNSKTALIVGQARGVVLLAASQNKLKTEVYTPLQVKISLTGYGKAEKAQVGQMVKVLLKLNEIPKPDDTADALAICLTHAFSSKLKNLGK